MKEFGFVYKVDNRYGGDTNGTALCEFIENPFLTYRYVEPKKCDPDEDEDCDEEDNQTPVVEENASELSEFDSLTSDVLDTTPVTETETPLAEVNVPSGVRILNEEKISKQILNKKLKTIGF